VSGSEIAARSANALKVFVLTIAVLWTAAVASSLLWGAALVRKVAFSSSSVPMEVAGRDHEWLMGAGHLTLWLLGLVFLAFGGRWLLLAGRERDKAESDLVRERETLRLLYENSPDAIAVIDRGFRVLYANRRVEELAGAPLEALQGRACHERVRGRPNPCDGCLVEEVFREGHPAGRIRNGAAVDGRESWLWQQWYPIRGASGGVESVVEIARDVTDIKRAEAELACYAANLEEANRLKDLFTDIMSHDLLNPAAASRYFVDRLREGETDPRRLQFVDTIERNLCRLIAMIENVSAYSRLRETQALTGQALDVGEVVRRVLADIEGELLAAGISVEGPAAGVYPAFVHPMFGNVVANLVGNAVKYAAGGKRIAVGIESRGEQWVLSVTDWGEGIADAHKKGVFTRFERLGKEGVKGSGLGLAIARRIDELHKGRIWVEDNPEGGSVFRVSISRADASVVEAAGARAGAGSA
jgi:PAS domain S-box-containing protein